jgi:hypothetical protein
VEPPGKRKSVGAEVNWGIRFDAEADAVTFLEKLAGKSIFHTIFTFVIDMSLVYLRVRDWRNLHCLVFCCFGHLSVMVH